MDDSMGGALEAKPPSHPLNLEDGESGGVPKPEFGNQHNRWFGLADSPP
jgi:hypothetical protein